jgi:FOG: WD40 repeat
MNSVSRRGFVSGALALTAGCAIPAPGAWAQGGGAHPPLPDLEAVTLALGTRAGALSADGTRYAVADDRGGFAVADTRTGDLRFRVWPHQGQLQAPPVNLLTFSPDGRLLATASQSQDQTAVRLWDVRAAGAVRQVLAHESGVDAMAFAPDGARLVTASFRASPQNAFVLRLWEAGSGRALATEPSGGASMALLAFTSAARLVGIDEYGMVTEWEVGAETLRPVGRRALLPAGIRIQGCPHLAPAGDRVVLAVQPGSVGRRVVIFDIASGRRSAALATEAGNWPLGFTADGARVLVSSYGKREEIALVDAHTGAMRKRVAPGAATNGATVFAPGAGVLVSHARADVPGVNAGGIGVWELALARRRCQPNARKHAARASGCCAARGGAAPGSLTRLPLSGIPGQVIIACQENG